MVTVEQKGTYKRRIEDIDLALAELDVNQLPNATKFLVLYFACEKLAKGLVGIHQGKTAEEAYPRHGGLNLGAVTAAANDFGLGIKDDDLARLFERQDEPATATSARALRDRFTHNFGPTNVKNIQRRGVPLVPLMLKFLSFNDQILQRIA